MQISFPFCVNLGRTFFQNTAKITQEMGNKTEFYDCPQRKVRFYHFKLFATDLISLFQVMFIPQASYLNCKMQKKTDSLHCKLIL